MWQANERPVCLLGFNGGWQGRRFLAAELDFIPEREGDAGGGARGRRHGPTGLKRKHTQSHLN